MRRTHRQPVRAGFTLVEMLVVISIITLLVGLLLAGVQAARGTMLRVQSKNDIQEFNTSLQAWMSTKTNNVPLPSKVVLCENISDYFPGGAAATNVDAQATFSALTAIFGPRVMAQGVTVNWNGDGTPSGRTFSLNGNEALVFWCGGIPSAPGTVPTCLGFNTSSGNPAASPQRLPFNFSSSRLVRTNNPNASNFLVYLDSYGTPYAYFATHGAQNNYQQDCPGYCPGFTPYYTAVGPPTQFANATTFQIVSAGADRTFGTGGAWNPQGGMAASPDADNITNFTQGVLAGGQ
jgi:prepilin-type N-terminal cleavage/methylation domain-containing protein